jgi:adenylylsulfate kinase
MQLPGKVIWITGLAGSGKTTIGKVLYEKLKERINTIILLDGDELRMVFGGNFGYSYDERQKAGEQYSRLCKMISMQGISVICCAIGMNESVRKWNYKNIDKYIEVYINTPMPILEQRDKKCLYSRAKSGIIKNVVGVDIPAETPKKPDVEIVNDGNEKINNIVLEILEKIDGFEML